MFGNANLVQRVDQGILTVRFERNVEVDGGVGGWVTLEFPVGRDDIPRVHRVHVFPMWGGLGKADKGLGSKDEEHRDLMVEHRYRFERLGRRPGIQRVGRCEGLYDAPRASQELNEVEPSTAAG